MIRENKEDVKSVTVKKKSSDENYDIDNLR